MNDFDQNPVAINHLPKLPGECSIPSAGTKFSRYVPRRLSHKLLIRRDFCEIQPA